MLSTPLPLITHTLVQMNEQQRRLGEVMARQRQEAQLRQQQEQEVALRTLQQAVGATRTPPAAHSSTRTGSSSNLAAPPPAHQVSTRTHMRSNNTLHCHTSVVDTRATGARSAATTNAREDGAAQEPREESARSQTPATTQDRHRLRAEWQSIGLRCPAWTRSCCTKGN